jgi:DivIVA domain-containing protein
VSYSAHERPSLWALVGSGNYGPPVNGDGVRDTTFMPTGNLTRAYDVAEVDELLGRIAAELDAGRQVGSLIENATFQTRVGKQGYDVEAVDWFLEQLRCREGHSELNGMSDPWRDLAVGNWITYRRSGDLADHTGTPSQRARRKERAQNRKCLAQECADAWRDFGQQPGAQLRLVWTGRFPWGAMYGELLTAEGRTVACARSRWPAWPRPTAVSTSGRTYTWKPVTGSALPGIAIIRELADLDPARELLDETGAPILYTSGKNFNLRAGACITFPDQRWLKFPVRGTEWKNAIMTAVDQAGNKIAQYKVIQEGDWLRNEITVHPGQQLTNELVLALVISAPWLNEYFTSPSRGG